MNVKPTTAALGAIVLYTLLSDPKNPETRYTAPAIISSVNADATALHIFGRNGVSVIHNAEYAADGDANTWCTLEDFDASHSHDAARRYVRAGSPQGVLAPSVKVGAIVAYHHRPGGYGWSTPMPAELNQTCPAIVRAIDSSGTLHLTVFAQEGAVNVGPCVESANHPLCWSELKNPVAGFGSIFPYRDAAGRRYAAIVRDIGDGGKPILSVFIPEGVASAGPCLRSSDSSGAVLLAA